MSRLLTTLLILVFAILPAQADMRPYNEVKLVNGWKGTEWYEDDGTFQFCEVYQETVLEKDANEKMRWSFALGDEFYAMKLENSEAWDRKWLKELITYSMPHLSGALKAQAHFNMDTAWGLTDVLALVFNEHTMMFDLDFKESQKEELTKQLMLAETFKVTIFDGSPRQGWISYTVGMRGSIVAFKWLDACYKKQKGLKG